MKAVLYRAYGPIENLELGDVPLPVPGRGELLVRVHRAALNPKDSFFRKGRFRIFSGTGFPKLCGLDFAGVVEESRSPHFQKGQRVFGMLEEWKMKRGSLAEHLVCTDEEAGVLPEGVSDERGAATALAGLTAYQALHALGRVRSGSRVLVHGASGGVGTFAIQLARLLGAEVHTTSSAANQALCTRLGATRAWDYTTSALHDSRPHFEVVFDVFGDLRVSAVRPWLRPRGVFISTVPSPGRLVRHVLTRVLPVQERLVVVRARRHDLTQLGAWLADGRLEAVIDSRYPLDRVHDAFRVLESKRTRGKLIIVVANG